MKILAPALAFAAALAATPVPADVLSCRLDGSAMSEAAFRHLVAGVTIIEGQAPRRAASDIAEVDHDG